MEGVWRGLEFLFVAAVALGGGCRAKSARERLKAPKQQQSTQTNNTVNPLSPLSQELGAVDEQGINFDRLPYRAKAGWLAWVPGLGRRAKRRAAAEAVVLDMGTYERVAPPAAAAPATASAPAAQSPVAGAAVAGAAAGAGGAARGASKLSREGAAAGGAGSKPGAAQPQKPPQQQQPAAPPPPPARLHLIQVLPHALAGRALVFGNRLALKADEWAAVEPPYFAAPATFEAALGDPGMNSALGSPGGAGASGGGGGGAAGDGSERGAGGAGAGALAAAPSAHHIGRAPLPPVTVVFAKALGLPASRGDLARCEALLTECARACLAAAPGRGAALAGAAAGGATGATGAPLPPAGYLVRVQEGDLRYMLAFAHPVAALEWCLLMQVRLRGRGVCVWAVCGGGASAGFVRGVASSACCPATTPAKPPKERKCHTDTNTSATNARRPNKRFKFAPIQTNIQTKHGTESGDVPAVAAPRARGPRVPPRGRRLWAHRLQVGV